MFEVQKENYNSNQDFGAACLKELCQKLGLEHKEEPSYGYLTATYQGHEISLSRERRITKVRLYSSSLGIKGMLINYLTEKQVSNLTKKLDSLVSAKKERDNVLGKKNAINHALYQLGLEVNDYRKEVTVDGFTFTYDKDTKKLVSYDELPAPYVHLKTSDTVANAEKRLRKILGEFTARKAKHDRAYKKAVKHLEKIHDYFSL